MTGSEGNGSPFLLGPEGGFGGWLCCLLSEARDSLDSISITRFFTQLYTEYLGAGTIHQAYRTLKVFCRWLLATGAADSNP